MISGLANALIGSWLYLAAAGVAPTDLDSLLAALAREPPQSIAFVEVHTSPLLEDDLVVAGSLEYAGSGKLSRVVTKPYRERTDIEDGEVRIQRDGRPERRFPLHRNRELGGLLAAFSALLAGDRASLERSSSQCSRFNQPDGSWTSLRAMTGRRTASAGFAFEASAMCWPALQSLPQKAIPQPKSCSGQQQAILIMSAGARNIAANDHECQRTCGSVVRSMGCNRGSSPRLRASFAGGEHGPSPFPAAAGLFRTGAGA